jgi:AraC family transcriptional activator of pobA
VQRLNRLVRAESGKPALEWIHERLTREACRRLRYIAAPASSWALELGFDDSAYFSRFFKRRTGFSPHQWRLTQQESLILDKKIASGAL